MAKKARLSAIALLMALAIPLAALAQSKVHEGLIKKVEGMSVVVQAKDGREVTLTADAETSVTLDGKPASVSDLKEGMYVDWKADKSGKKVYAIAARSQKG